MLARARALGLDRVLAVCEVGNVASARTIQRQGGVPEPLSDGAGTRRYWIRTGPRAGCVPVYIREPT
jgi:predicted acetyltransferase